MKQTILSGLFLLMFMLVGLLNFGTVEASPTIVDFEIEIELKDGTEYEIEYAMKSSKIQAKYVVPREVALFGEEALPKVEAFFQKVNVIPDANKEKLIAEALRAFGIDVKDVDEFELDVIFDGDKKLTIQKKFS
ncbi:hypothetical protein JCM9140_2646 [Halalkalibacter wakoensis JCM 9140]|uniref:Uncharacterized protein n=1 Tax=Halalkalibacter wakoensis JCM 9140 TaxID=1236970 RepID=W4Q3P3_9BACI|nr:YusW family protein [Halalkalibacter wakoensis]GAE26565.1 hypothetical protein JCM9140_2646 [Halalkalibacter wakoensis JCM 9140]